ncbi:MAG: S8 family serine peptidase, partial [Vicinamibacteria bacterium]
MRYPAGELGFRFGASAILALLAAAFLFGDSSQSPARGASSPSKLSAFLERLSLEYDLKGEQAAKQLASGHGMKSRAGDFVPVILEPHPAVDPRNVDKPLVRALGGEIDAVSRSYVRVIVPIRKIRKLADHPDVRLVRGPTPARALAVGLGGSVSESPSLVGADALQAAGITGAGVRVAVVDLGFVGLAQAIARGELPSDTVAVDFTATGIESDTEHGVGVAEHLLDMAPGAKLYCIKVSDEVDLENSADYVRSQGIRVANHSVGWVTSSYYDDTGPINAIVNRSRDTDGVLWFVAAGNDAQSHWRGSWTDGDGDGFLNFSSTDERMDLLSSNSSVSLFLNWDQYGNSVTDLDLYVYT